MGKLVEDVRGQRLNSDAYDEPMLTRLSGWEGLLETRVKSMILPSGGRGHVAFLDIEVITGAKALNSRIPAPRQVRVVGRVDMVRHSTRSLGLHLIDGEEIRCAVVNEAIASLADYYNRDVTILGKAVYRPSGSVLRLDVEMILDTTDGREHFSTVPLPFNRRTAPDRKAQSPRSGVSAIFGTWPGEETDEELIEALAELRG
jgi:hypothetical protein